jgi:coenzyme F420 hydrogenase subunit beta
MSVKSKNMLLRVMKSELCNRCGSCVGLSGGKIVFRDKEGKYLPVCIQELTEEETERLWQACPGKLFSFPDYRQYFYQDSKNFHVYLGAYDSIWTGYATSQEIRQRSSSGGILTAMLLYLMRKDKIKGAIVTRMSAQTPWFPETFIATSEQEIIESAQSKYIITSVNEILEKSQHFKGDLAYVGLPGQVQSIRKLQKAKDPAIKNIKYIFGPFYGNTLYFSSIKSFLRSHREQDYTDIKKLWFRYGEWPGSMRVEMNSGKVYELKKFHANWLIPFHILRNSLYCTDLTNEFTDISGGDAWSPEYENRGEGFSIVISRNAIGQEIIKNMVRDGWLSLTPLNEKEAIDMHSHGYDFKKRGSFIRIRFRQLLRRPVPDWGYSLKGFKFSRYLMEIIICTLFLLCATRLARWLVERVPPGLIGRIFEKTRKVWKRSTYSIKRNDLL